MGKGAVLKLNGKRLFSAITNGNLELLTSLQKFGYKFDEINFEGKNCLVFAIINKNNYQSSILNFFK
jgi:hypothetical protein